MAIYIRRQPRVPGDDPFDELAETFSQMTEEERDSITAVHPLLDGLTLKKGAKFLCISERALCRRLEKLLKKFPSLNRKVKGRNWNKTGGRPKKDYPGRDLPMEMFAKSFGLESMEYEFIKLVHPIFDIDMTREQACETLGWSAPTGLRVWKNIVERFPELIESMGKWVNPNEIPRHNFDNPKRINDPDDPYFGDDKIVRKF